MSGAAPLVVVMGVAGVGKSTIGRRVAERLGLAFVDGDDAHTAAAKAQMHRGIPLTEGQRGPWLDQLHGILEDARGEGIVLACSALTAASRRRLAGDLAVRFVALVAPEEVLAERLATRSEHFAGPSLLASQLATLELDDGVATVDATGPLDVVVEAAVRAVTV